MQSNMTFVTKNKGGQVHWAGGGKKGKARRKKTSDWRGPDGDEKPKIWGKKMRRPKRGKGIRLKRYEWESRGVSTDKPVRLESRMQQSP